MTDNNTEMTIWDFRELLKNHWQTITEDWVISRYHNNYTPYDFTLDAYFTELRVLLESLKEIEVKHNSKDMLMRIMLVTRLGYDNIKNFSGLIMHRKEQWYNSDGSELTSAQFNEILQEFADHINELITVLCEEDESLEDYFQRWFPKIKLWEEKNFPDGPMPTADKAIPEGYIDLGLPSGKLWANCNLDASKPKDSGRYYAFGETEGALPNDDGTFSEVDGNVRFGWDWYNSLDLTDDKILDENGNLKPEYDAVSLATNGVAHMPTKFDIMELWKETNPKLLVKYNDTEEEVELEFNMTSMETDNETYFYASWNWGENSQGNYTVLGTRFYSKVNSNSIFVPAAGLGDDGQLRGVGGGGVLWSASRYDDGGACYLGFGGGGGGVDSNLRCVGFPLRGVI